MPELNIIGAQCVAAVAPQTSNHLQTKPGAQETPRYTTEGNALQRCLSILPPGCNQVETPSRILNLKNLKSEFDCKRMLGPECSIGAGFAMIDDDIARHSR